MEGEGTIKRKRKGSYVTLMVGKDTGKTIYIFVDLPHARSHKLNKNPSTRQGIPPFKLLVRRL